MPTQLSIVNNVLRRLRETEVSSITLTDYSLLIADFVNEAMLVIQEAHDWSALEQTVEFDLEAGKHYYDLAPGGDALAIGQRLPNQKSYLLWNQSGFPQTWYLIDGEAPPKQQFKLINEATMERLFSEEPTLQARYPQYLSLRVNDLGTGWRARVYNIPQEPGVVTTKWWIPQDTFALDGSDNNTEVIVRPDLVFTYALRAALNERGEEMGEPGNMADQRFMSFLYAAIETDLMNRSRTGRYEFTPD